MEVVAEVTQKRSTPKLPPAGEGKVAAYGLSAKI